MGAAQGKESDPSGSLMDRGRKTEPIYIVPVVQSANTSPLGWFAFALTTALLQGPTTTLTEPGTGNIVFAYAAGYGGLAELLAGMFEAGRGKMFSAIIFSSYGAFWLSFAVFGILTQTGIFKTLGPAPEGMQMLLALWSFSSFLLFLNALAMNLALQSILGFLTITFALLSAGVTHPAVNKAGGVLGFITAACAFYTAFAELTNDTFNRRVVPLGTINWYRYVFHMRTPDASYDVQRTDVRTLNPQGIRNSGGGVRNSGVEEGKFQHGRPAAGPPTVNRT